MKPSGLDGDESGAGRTGHDRRLAAARLHRDCQVLVGSWRGSSRLTSGRANSSEKTTC